MLSTLSRSRAVTMSVVRVLPNNMSEHIVGIVLLFLEGLGRISLEQQVNHSDNCDDPSIIGAEIRDTSTDFRGPRCMCTAGAIGTQVL
jgi:hypothetical protein